MGNLAAVPAGSVITERDEWEGRRLSWPLPGAGYRRFFAVAFLSCWLCGWAVGWVTVAVLLCAGGGNLFLIGWFGAWTVGGGAAIWSLWTMLRVPRPESITLGPDHLDYDPGTTPASLVGTSRFDFWHGQSAGGLTPPRLKQPIRVAKVEIRKFLIDRAGERQRLTFDRGAKRIEIGASLEEPEREWLQATLEAWRLG